MNLFAESLTNEIRDWNELKYFTDNSFIETHSYIVTLMLGPLQCQNWAVYTVLLFFIPRGMFYIPINYFHPTKQAPIISKLGTNQLKKWAHQTGTKQI